MTLHARWLSEVQTAWLIRQASRENVLQCSFGASGVLLQPIEGNRWAFDALAAKEFIDADYRAALAKATA